MSSSSFALKLQTPETAHSEGTETEENRYFFQSFKKISFKARVDLEAFH
jgi:hypothetical protein